MFWMWQLDIGINDVWLVNLRLARMLEEQGIDPVLWGLTDKDFELLAKNFAQIRNQLKITNDLLDKYKEYYESDLEDKNEK